MTETDTTTTLFCHTPDGAKLAYRVLGAKQKGVPLIMLTGMASVKEDWDDLASALALHRPVCIYDHRGIGASTLSPPLPPFKTAPSLTLTQLSTDTFHIIHDALQWRTFHVLGMSMGVQQIEALSTGFDLTPQLPLITVPTLVIHGTHDEIIPVEHGHAIASGIPGARFLPLQDVGHITYRMDDGQTLRAVDEFLREIDAKSAVESIAVKL
ncbi:hypothetical protein HDU90_008375 [Geranomyces variabilis]|nr:hypothetical protein HDU90_008375 [Geranomyces variabilis]